MCHEVSHMSHEVSHMCHEVSHMSQCTGLFHFAHLYSVAYQLIMHVQCPSPHIHIPSPSLSMHVQCGHVYPIDIQFCLSRPLLIVCAGFLENASPHPSVWLM